MYVPMPIFMTMAVISGIFGFLILCLFHVAMTDKGLKFIGRRDFYQDKGLLVVRWHLFYIPIYTYETCHSTMMD